MADPARKLAGFNELSQGMDSGIAPVLLPPNQSAMAVNVTFRGDFPETRPPWKNHVLNGGFDTGNNPLPLPATWTGIFQGSQFYVNDNGQSGWVVARGGRFFFVTDDTFSIREITPQIIIVTTAAFTLPGAGSNVLVNFNGNAPVNVGDTVMIGAIHYTVAAIFNMQLRLTQVDAGAGTVAAGALLFDATGTNQLIQFEVYPANINFVFMFQAENYVIVLGGHEHTMIWDGTLMRPSGTNEVPSGFIGAYGWGRIWIVNPDRRTFVAGDIVFGPSGTPQNGFRDAILKFTENTFLNEGGSFGVPYEAGPITAMQFLATQDTSLGIGVLLVGTTNMVFSVNAPVDRTIWKDLTYPIQTVSLIDYGPMGPRSTISVNGDMWYRSLDGVRSFVVARRLFGSPGNTPMSHEVDEVLDFDTSQLLFYGSAVFFDNKIFMTVSPVQQVSNQVIHRGMVVINFDLVSDLKVKQNPAWEGVHTGLDHCQISKARIDNDERMFSWVAGAGDTLELWENLTKGIADEFNTDPGGVLTVQRKAIGCLLQTRAEDYGLPLELKRLIMGEIYVEDVADTVTFQIFYRPDSYPNWIPWQTFTLCSSVTQCSPDVNNCFFVNNARSYAARLTLPQPAETCNGMTGTFAREFHDCQFQLLWTGHCRVKRFFTHAKIQTQPTEGTCPPQVTCVAVATCGDNLFTYDSHP